MKKLNTPKCVFISKEVRKPIIEPHEKPGDVDLLIIPQENMERSLAIECKRAKIEILDNGEEKINKISGIDKGIWQSR